jgi:hypothetical protein
MANMFNLISNLGTPKRNDYGVSDLLAEVSKRSASISAEDREEINAMSRRLRQHNKTNDHTPRQTPENSHHGMMNPSNSNNNKKGFGKDMLKKDDLLRGFANLLLHSPSKQDHDESIVSSPPTSPNGPDCCDSGPVLRDFSSPGTSPDSSESAEDGDDPVPFETEQKL